MNAGREFFDIVSSMTEAQRADFLELLELIDGDFDCMSATVDFMKNNGVEGAHDFVRNYKRQKEASGQ